METAGRVKLVVLDANFYWTEQLFSACGSFADVLLLHTWDYRNFYQRYGGYFVDWQPRAVSEHVWEQRICCPPGWQFRFWSITERFLVRLIRRYQGDDPLVFVFCYPHYYTIASKLSKSFSIYYNMDDYSDYWPRRVQQTKAAELQAANNASLTACIAHHRSTLLKTSCPDAAHRIAHIPLGCSPKFMSTSPLQTPLPLPDGLKQFERPVAGYIGALNYRFDFHFMAQVAERLPNVQFVLGGDYPQQSHGDPEWWYGVERVQQLANVHFIGHVPHASIGAYLQSLDCLLMVYSRTDFNTNSCPMKLWDYFGATRPIVSNDVVPEVRLWQHLIRISQTPEDFATDVRFVLQNSGWKSSERLTVALENTWQHQAQKLYRILSSEWQVSSYQR